MHDWFSPKAAEGSFIRLEPLCNAHAADLFEAADPETFRYMLWTPDPWATEGFEELVRRRQSDSVPFAVVHKVSNRAIGVTTYLELNRKDRGIEIGYTWYGKPWRGTVVNPESKLLMLQRAFDELQCVRVQLKCDDRNEASKAGIAKLGAKFEGVVRNHRILEDGHLRQTALFSIIASEWPEVRAKLVERIQKLRDSENAPEFY